MWALRWNVWHFTTFSCVWYVSLKSSLACGLCFVVWCEFSNCIGEAVLERFFVKFHSAELTHTDDLWKISKIPHTTVRSAHTGKFSNIVIFPKQIQSFLIGNFLSIWPTNKEFSHIWGFSEKSIPSGMRVLKNPMKDFREHHQQISNIFTLQKLTWASYCFCTIWAKFPGATPRTANMYRVKWH